MWFLPSRVGEDQQRFELGSNASQATVPGSDLGLFSLRYDGE